VRRLRWAYDTQRIRDLLVGEGNAGSSSATQQLRVREDPVKGVYVEGLQERCARMSREALPSLTAALEGMLAPVMRCSQSWQRCVRTRFHGGSLLAISDWLLQGWRKSCCGGNPHECRLITLSRCLYRAS